MKLCLVAAGLCLAGQLALAPPALHAATQNSNAKSSTVRSQTSRAHNSPEQRLTREAARMLQQVSDAQKAIRSHDTQAALQHVKRALAEHSRIAAVAKSEGMPTIVPLYTEFDASSTIGSLERSRQRQQSGSAKPASYGVENSAETFTFVGLDLNKAKRRLDEAKTALDNKNPQAAEHSLDEIGNELVMETVENDLPLLTARQNLGLAEMAAENAHYREAATALRDASTALEKYASGSSAQHSQEAKSLSESVRAFSQKIERRPAAAADRIDGWWHQVNGWFSQPTQAS